ncbi:MAG TPA: glycosyltransferase [Tepidisphaeraceae bacterium]|nr:glycosyltransferase [Tepidisphaeraceae bacterium]
MLSRRACVSRQRSPGVPRDPVARFRKSSAVMAHKPLRILYAAGPGDVLGTYRHWKLGQDDPTQVAMTYSGQFYDLVKEFDAQAYVIATCRTRAKLRDGNFRIEHRPVPFENSAGLLYHLGQFWYGLRLLVSALRTGCNVAVVCAGTHWFVLALMTLFGIRVVPTVHCVLWKKFGWNPTPFQRLVHTLNGWFFTGGCAAIVSVSDEVTQQLGELTDSRARPVREFVPQYRASSFAAVRPADPGARPFRVLYVGRIERNKGVFDLLRLARSLEGAGAEAVEFDVCGDGSALGELRAAISAAGLDHRLHCHGHCGRERMVDMYSRAHAVIVPTTTDFIEGFNKVVAEGVLAGRPVITSSVCPALSYVRGSVVEVPPDDVDAYAAAIRRLRDDPAWYQTFVTAAAKNQPQFYDPQRGWAAAVREVLLAITGDAAHDPRGAPRPIDQAPAPRWATHPVGKSP